MLISDWSSDVCSSDLATPACELRCDAADPARCAVDEDRPPRLEIETTRRREQPIPRGHQHVGERCCLDVRYRLRFLGGAIDRDRYIIREGPFRAIGRASCRESVCQYV